MSRIHLLEDSLIDKIAAGEVVERPASVLKELIENAIDAGASHIRVDLEEGGCRSIVITDNGQGIAAEDGLLAVKRHATSKIRSLDDLFNVVTMGFRGEALASIAAVSDFTLFSQQPGAAVGVKISKDGDDFSAIPWNGPQGTTVRVADLFYNVPVRKGFLKKTATEYAASHDYLEALALCLPEIGFALYHNGKEQLIVSGQQGSENDGVFKGEKPLRARVGGVLGSKVAKDLVYVKETSKFGAIEALISPPGVEKNSASHIFTFVNGRWVKDKTLRYGVLRGYQSHLLKGKFPVAIVHLTIDPSLVDVNVHPTKTEIRLQYATEVQSMVAMAMRSGLRQGLRFGATHDEETPALVDDTSVKPSPFAPSTELAYIPRLALEATPYEASAVATMPTTPWRSRLGERATATSVFGADAGHKKRETGQDIKPESAPLLFAGAGPDKLISPSGKGAEGAPHIPWHELEYIGSFASCYLMFTFHDMMLVVDQHAFHERVLYENLLKDDRQLTRSQRLLVPEAVELTPAQKELLWQRREELEKFGFVLKDIKDTVLVEIHAVPMILTGKDLESTIYSLVDPKSAAVGGTIIPEASHDVLARLACHAAVRAGEQLDEVQIKQLMMQASGVDFYHNCPHGRRVWRLFKKSDVAAWFDR